jgi:hypothetical protein
LAGCLRCSCIKSLESPFEAPSPPHEEVVVTSLETGVHLDDVIERIEKLIMYVNSTPSQSAKQPGISQKCPPKLLTKTLDSVHPDEV